MKAERRHELQHNEVADWVAEAIEWLKPYSRAIVGVVVAATVLITAYYVLSARSERKQANSWTDYYLALEAPKSSMESELESVAREYSSVSAGRWAEVTLADLQLGEGLDLLFSDKTAANKKLESAAEHYQAVIEHAEDPLLLARARFGLGRAQESLGHLDEAVSAFEEVVNASGTNAYVELAKSRLNDLKRTSTRDFYAWFEKQEPVTLPPEPSSTLPGTPGQKPPFDESMLGSPGKIDLSGEKLLDLPDLEKGRPGPALTAPNTQNDKAGGESAAKTPPDESQTKPPKTGDATDDSSKTENTKQSGVTESETKELAPQKESEKDAASGAPKPADEKSDAAPNDGAKGSESAAAKDEPKGGQPDAKSPNGG
jgi:predicted negative regulator of RcsB-dependent stress response